VLCISRVETTDWGDTVVQQHALRRAASRTGALRGGHRRRAIVPAVAVALAAAVAGCGSSSSSSSSSSTTTSTATTATAGTAHLIVIHGAASPAGAVKPSTAALAKLVHVNKGSGTAAHIQGLSNLPLQQQISTLDGDINSFWSKLFAQSGVQWPQAQEAFVTNQPVQTQCSSKPTIAPTDPWFLCDPVFYWPLPWMQQNIQPNGDVFLAFSVAIFWSFHVQNVLGFTQALQQGQMSKAQWANQTLCLTGLYIRTIGQRNLFEQGDTQAANQFLTSLQGVNGISAPDVTNQSLTQAFVAGYNGGDPATCGVGNGGGGGGGGGGGTTPTTTPSPMPTTPGGGGGGTTTGL
jgi:predicted metalloprotease